LVKFPQAEDAPKSRNDQFWDIVDEEDPLKGGTFFVGIFDKSRFGETCTSLFGHLLAEEGKGA